MNIASDDLLHPIIIGRQLLGDASVFLPYIVGHQACIITNAPVAEHYLSLLRQALTVPQVDVLMLPDGEAYKTLATWELVLDYLFTHGHQRSSTLIALGGGVVGDIAGFAAACYQRGMAYIQVPTSLLAQVDASLGGKTGVNHAFGKNMIGAFHQPKAVIIDVDTLLTLPEREFHAGLAEVIKYGLIADGVFFAWLEEHMTSILQRDPDALLYLIQRSCAIKADIVRRDEKDQNGLRATLNFGHTFAHAIETLTEYAVYLHGEAVAMGMVMAAELSVEVCQLDSEVPARLLALLRRIGLPTKPPVSPHELMDIMGRDKKNKGNGVTFVVLPRLGLARLCEFRGRMSDP